MSICMYCGAENPDGAEVCPACGSQLPRVVSTGRKKKSKRKGNSRNVLPILAAFVLVLTVLAAAGIWLLNYLSPASKLKRAINATVSSLEEQVRQQPSINNLIEVFNSVSDRKKASFTLEYTGASEQSYVLNFGYNSKKNTMSGSLQAHVGEAKGELLFALKKDVFQLAIPNVSPDVFGFSLKDARESVAVQAVQAVLGIDITSGIPGNFNDVLDDYLTAGKNLLDDFWEIAKVESMDSRDSFKVYRVTWTLEDVTDILLSKHTSVLSEELYKLLGEISGGCTCYVNDSGNLVRIEAVVGVDLYTLEWNQQGNPWGTITLSSSNSDTELKGEVFPSENEFRAMLSVPGSEPLIRLSYRDDNHAFEVKIGEFSMNGLFFGSPESAKIQFIGDNGETTTIEFGNLSENPSLLSSKYTDLLDMDLGEISELAIRFAIHTDTIKAMWSLFSNLIHTILP